MPRLRPHLPPILPLLAFVCAANPPALAADIGSGPPAAFSRHGGSVCASYSIDGTYDLYRDRIFARSGQSKAPISGLPQGRPKPGGPGPEPVVAASFKACANAPSESAPLIWIDQSCASAQGVCLPPRAFEIAADGKVRALGSAEANALFSASMSDSAPAPSSGWSFGFTPRQP